MQSRIVLLLIALLSFNFSLGPVELARAEAKNESKNAAKATTVAKLPPGRAWSFHQSSIILGEFDVLVNSSGLRAECRRSGITFIAHAPDWYPIGYSSRSGTIWRTKKESFAPINDTCKSLPILGLPNIWLIPVVHKGHKDVSGFACESFITTQKWTAEQVKQFEQHLVNKSVPRSAEYQATEIDLPKQAYGILEKIYGAPTCALMPIHFSYTTMKGSVAIALRTDSVKQATPPKNWLEIPPKLKPVKTFNELNMDQGAQAGAEDLFGN